jgi:hypothetical protein
VSDRLRPQPLEYLTKLARARQRERAIDIRQAQREITAEYGFDNWSMLVRHVQASSPGGSNARSCSPTRRRDDALDNGGHRSGGCERTG